MKTITITEEQYEKIKPILNESRGMWKPEDGEQYYIITAEGFVCSTYAKHDANEKSNFPIGNFYRTEEEAKAKVEWLKAVQRIKEYIAREFGEFEPDWNYVPENKYHIYYHVTDSVFKKSNSVGVIYPTVIGYLRSSEHAEQLIKDCETDLKIVFNVK